jgi:uncharacterized lipoprotein YajG
MEIEMKKRIDNLIHLKINKLVELINKENLKYNDNEKVNIEIKIKWIKGGF